MRPRPIAGLVTVLLIASARTSAAQSLADDGSAIPGKIVYFGVTGGAFISGSPGLAVSGLLTLEWKRAIVSAEVGFGETFSGWDRFRAGGQAGAFLLPDPDAPYFLAGVERGTFVDIVHEKRGRDDLSLTLEVGYAVRRLDGGRQRWFGARGLIQIVPHPYNAEAPALPAVELIAKFLL